ncbi:MAG TPA: hypothetical protein VN106_11730 [Sphingomicrobium sp.]|nr:hypothetical protein [Sphingomicrobium sp.]
MRRLVLLIGLAASGQGAAAQPIVTSPAPSRVAVTVYRDPDRGVRPFNLRWLGGYALVSETRHVSLPAGESELRFEGVTGGIVPQSAIVTGLGEAVLEKNRDARLLSPGALLDASLGERLTLRRTSVATGAVREQDAIVRAAADGVVIETAAGIEALRCTGLPETLLAKRVPAGLSAKPTLSVRIRSPQPVERDVTLSYITNNFDWQADYIGELSPDGSRLSLFGWLTLANGDATGLSDAATQAVAGKLNRNRVWVDPGRASPISIRCWPSATTSDVPEEMLQAAQDIVVTGSRIRSELEAPPPPPPPPAPMIASKVMASEERLGDVRLYRVPIAVTVASHSQKQIALLERPAVKVESILRLRPVAAAFDLPLERVLRTRNDTSDGLGLALPAGKLELFRDEDGRRLLVGEGRMDDHTVGEKVEIVVGSSTGIRARQTVLPVRDTTMFRLVVSNDTRTNRAVEIELPIHATAVKGGKLASSDGWSVWRVRVPANGTRTLVYKL